MSNAELSAFPADLFQAAPDGIFPTHSLLNSFDNNLGHAIGSTLLVNLVQNPLLQGTESDEVLEGTGQNEGILGDAGHDVLAGKLGHDLLMGNDGDDVIRGDANSRKPGGTIGGDDLMLGGVGDDYLGGKGGNDWLMGGLGNDHIWGDHGHDVLYGGLGDDTLTGDDFSGGTGDDIFALRLGEGIDTITDFGNGLDKILLLGGLTYEQLSLTETNGNTWLAVGTETLGIVKNATGLTETDFIGTGQPTNSTPTDTEAPVIQAALANDTGINASDRLTSDPTIQGTVTDNGEVVSLLAGLNDTPIAAFSDITSTLEDGAFTLDAAALAALNGGALPDGEYTLKLIAIDGADNASDVIEVTFSLDTVIQAPSLNLAPAFDSGTLGDDQTLFATVALTGSTEANVLVELPQADAATVSNNSGQFTFNTVDLADGENSLTAIAMDAAGNQAEVTTTISRVVDAPIDNAAPEITSTPETLVSSDETSYQYQVQANDDDGDSLTYQLTTGPAGAIIDANTGLLMWTTTEAEPGTYPFTVQVRDSQGGIDTQSFAVLLADPTVTGGSIAGSVWKDLNGNGQRDDNEPGFEDVEVYLDLNDNEEFDEGEPVQISAIDNPNTSDVDETGQYVFTELAAGSYAVRQVVPEGYEATTPASDGYANLTVTASESFETLDFGNRSSDSTPENQAPVFISDPLETFSIPLPGEATGDVTQAFLNLSLDENETFSGSVAITLPTQGDTGGSADIVFIVDESGSMDEEHEWLTDLVLELDAALEAQGITDNRYSLTGFAGFDEAGVRNITLPEQLAIQVYGPSNQLIDVLRPSLPAADEMVLPADGDYTIVFNSEEETPLSYDLQVNIIDDDIDVAVEPSGFNEIQSQTIGSGEEQNYTFEAPAGLTVWFDSIASNSSGIQGKLLDPDGKVVTTVSSDRDTGPFTLPASGTYTLAMNGGNSGGDYSFQLIDMTNAPAVALDSPVDNTVDPRVTQVFQFEGSLGQPLFVNSTGASSPFRNNWTLYGPDNVAITSRENLRTDLATVLPDDGTYWLIVENEGNEPINHGFQIVTPETTVTSLNVGEVVSNTLEEAGETNIYQFEGQAGQGIWFDGIFAGALFGPDIKLLSPDGQRLLSAETDDNEWIITLPTSGTYSLVVGGNDDIGGYSFQILTTDEAPTIAAGEIVSTNLIAGTPTIHAIEGQAGQRLQFDAIDVDGALRGTWEVFNPDNTLLATGSQLESDFDVVLPVDGTYHVALRSQSDRTDYTFQITTEANEVVAPTGFGAINSNTLAANESDTYTFAASAGTRIWFDSLGASSGLRANLTGPNGESIFSNQSFWSGGDPDPYVLGASGLYTLTVDGRTTGGSYSFRLLNLEDATPLSLDNPTEVTLAEGLSTQLYQFEGSEGTQLFFDLDQNTASSLRVDWNLFYPGAGQASRFDINLRNDFSVTLPGDGTYVLAFESEDNSPIDVSFQVVTPETQVTPIAVSETVSGGLDEAGEIDRYTFIGTKGQKIWLDSLTTASEAFEVRLISPTGLDITGNQPLENDIGPISLTEEGLYTLRITGGDETGTYGFRIDDVANSEPLADGLNLVSSSDDTDTIQVFQLENGVAGQTLTFVPRPERFFTDAAGLSADTERLSTTRGGTEDGYAGLDAALQLPFRDEAAVNFILITDEARDNTDDSLTFDAIRTKIDAQDVRLDAALNAFFEDENETRALGIDANGTAYIADGEGGFSLSQGGEYTGSRFLFGGDTATIKENYVDLALAVDGAAWDLNQLRNGGDAATSFTQAFVEQQVEGIREQFSVDVDATNADVAFNNLTGSLSGLGSGDTADFDIEITGDGSAQSFELLFTRPESGFVLGTIPVVLNQGYQYPALAVDPDGDPLVYSLLEAPDEASIDATTGTIFWNPSAVGSYDFSIQVDDGRGGTAIQDFAVVVNAVNGDNQAPTITSAPPDAIIDTEQTFTYDVDATDPDGDTLTYYLASGPRGLVIDPISGEISWSPDENQVGNHQVEVLVLDGKGQQATQQFEIQVAAAEPNFAPFFASAPVTTAFSGGSYQYQPIAIDLEEDELTYRLSQHPDGMTIDPATGLVSWEPGSDDVSEYTVVIEVEDAEGNQSQQTFQLITTDEPVVDDPTVDTLPPELQIGISNSLLNPGDRATLQILATDDTDLASLSLELDGNPLTLTPEGTANGQLYTSTVEFDEPGVYTLVGEASDSAGNSVSETVDLRVLDSFDTERPEIAIDLSGLEQDGPLSSPYDITGIVDDPNLEFYRIEYAPVSLVDLSNPGEADPDYRVLAEGNASVDGVLGTLDPRFLDNDEYFVRVYAQDVNGQINVQGFTTSVVSENKVGNFTLDATDLTIPLTGIPITINRRYDTLQAGSEGDFGHGWELMGADARITESVASEESSLANFFTAESFAYGTRVTLTTPEGERVGFTFKPRPVPVPIFGVRWVPYFEPDPGVDAELSVPGMSDETLEIQGIDIPMGLTLSQRSDGTFGQAFPFGVIPFNPNSYILTTKEGLQYTYDQFEGLQTIEDRNGNLLTYSDEGIYSSTGEAVVFTRDAQDRITSITDPAGNAILYDYDDNGNLVAVTDRAGNVTRYTYDPNNPHYLVEEIDPLGRSSVRTEYDEQGRLTRIIDADGNALELNIDFGADSDRQLITDPLGNTTTLFYDERGNITQQIDAEGGLTQYVFDEGNNLTSVTDPRGNTTTYTYDERGNQLTETDALGNTTTYTYNEFNQVLTTTDARGHVTTNRYDERGNLLETEDPAGNITRYTYSASGNVESVIDPAGNATNYGYDIFDRLTEVEYAAGGITQFAYDNAGNLASITTPQGNTTTFGYDASGNIISVVDALGNQTQIQYNAAGERTAVIDALGRRTEYVYNNRGLLEETRYADGTVSKTVYDALDRAIQEIDQNGNAMTFEYDGLDRLIGVVDALGHKTQYGYDGAGNLTAQTDALNRTTSFEYDAVNQLIETALPLGQIETRTYDAVGNLASLTNFNGETITYEYTPTDLISAVRLPDASDELYTYTSTGLVESITDGRGVTQFEYDALDQLTRRLDPEGAFIEYSYDADGNISSLTTPSGTVSYTYDDSGQLAAVTDRVGNITTYNYDAVGNLVSTEFANGIVETREYDLLNRPLYIENQNSDGEVVSSYRYTLDDVGMRLSMEEHTGRVVTYDYDALYRLLQESVTDPVHGDQTTEYVYDEVGNRVSQANSVEGTTTYTYDDNDRLLAEMLDGITTEYSYDEAGNLITKATNGTVDVTYTWNSQGELAGATIADGDTNQVVNFVYDTDGIRVSRIVDGQVTHFLIDETQQEYAQVIEEYTPSGIVNVGYAHGDDLLSQQRGDASFFYHKDGLGSTQLLTDENGSVVNEYVYDAYGQIIDQTGLVANDYLFTGEQFDEALDSYYLRARYYEPEMSRFPSRDPFGGFQERPLSLNKYTYAEGNPVNSVDPSGEFAINYIQLLKATLIVDSTLGVSNAFAVCSGEFNSPPLPTLGSVLPILNFTPGASITSFVTINTCTLMHANINQLIEIIRNVSR